MRVLIACEYSGRVRDAFARRGHDAWSCDLRETESPGNHYQCDVRDVLDKGWDLMVAHPTCTRLANSGVRWLNTGANGKTAPDLWREMVLGCEFYRIFQDADIPRKAIENPIMHEWARRILRPGKRHVVQPWWFGDKAFKATGFELTNLPKLKPTNKLTPPKKGTPEHKEWSWIHEMPPGPEREKKRSLTFPGMAEAMAEQWGSTEESTNA